MSQTDFGSFIVQQRTELESDDIDAYNEKTKKQVVDGGGKKGNQFFKKITKFLFSHIGLVIMVIVYAVIGALLFNLLEEHNDAKQCQEGKGDESAKVISLKAELIKYIQFNVSMSGSDPSKDNETVANLKIEKLLVAYRDDIFDIQDTYGYSGQDCEQSKWNFPDALLFSVTIITTIGFGNISPSTWEGQITCICYAMLGIPLFLMCLANISGVLGDMFSILVLASVLRSVQKEARAAHWTGDRWKWQQPQW